MKVKVKISFKSDMESRMHTVTYLVLTVLFGYLGLHRFYRRQYKLGILYLFTLGICGIGWIIDSVIAVWTYIQDRKILIGHESNSSDVINNMPILSYDSSKAYDDMEGHEFEYFCADILRKNGFTDVDVTKGSGDQGIDILAFKDGVKYGIQCKCYSNDVGNKAVQEAFSGKTFYNCHVAAVLTNRYFTRSAQELSESNGVLLWDRNWLNKMIENTKTNYT